MRNRSLNALLEELVTDTITYFPIRHHSPACARYLEQTIRTRAPEAILIEGPAGFTSLIPIILHPKAKTPFAIYTSFVKEDSPVAEQGSNAKLAAGFGSPRFAAYYPFCDYSPELVALRVGAELGAKLRFIDLDYPDQIRAEDRAVKEINAPKVESLLAERYFQRSRYLRLLARRAGCRDHNDLWDHLFETRLPAASAGESQRMKFIQDVAAWCHFARVDATDAELKADGTLARESAMASAIKGEIAAGTKSILVVTGGFHTVVLPSMVRTKDPIRQPNSSGRNTDIVNCLIRYSFEQLDALNGYSAGMPSPYYYNQIWHASSEDGPASIFSDTAAKLLVDLGQLTRRKKLSIALSPADEIAALEQSRLLALIRSHPGPTREDLLDGMRSCFVKGSMDAEGEIVLGLARHVLGGTNIGETPPEAGMPPLVEDFRAIAKKFRLNINDTVKHKNSLDLYRKKNHREISRCFHALMFLDVPFAMLVAGPDFVKGTGLERLFEHWSYQWTSQTESQLVEASIYGATIEEAAANRLSRTIAELEESGRGRCASEAVGMLVHACRMGLHRYTERLLLLIARHVNEDPSLISLTTALNQLALMWESREPLEAHPLAGIPILIQSAFNRACYLLRDLADTPAQAAIQTLQSLIMIRDLVCSNNCGRPLDDNLFYEPLENVLIQQKCPALLKGGIAGLLYGAGRIAENQLLRLLTGSLNACSGQTGDQTAFLIGLLRSCRELAWRQPALVQAVESLLANWSEEEFVRGIPHLRLAFADLTPREADQVASVVAQSLGKEQMGDLYSLEFSESEMLAAVQLNAQVKKALDEDGLGLWIETASPNTHEEGSQS